MIGWRAPSAATAMALVALLAACAPSQLTPLAVADAAVVINTDKTIVDHVLSAANEQDCSTIRASQGGHYCIPYYENKPVVETLYCYRSLAQVTCYDRPSTNPRDRLVGVRPGGPLPTY